MMDFKRLRTFRVAARLLNFSQASAQLGYVQSAVTMQIKALEENLGVPLFERNGRNVALTQAGRTLLTYADQLFALREEAVQAIIADDEPSGPLCISGHETVLTYRLPVLLDQFVKNFPKVQLSILPIDINQLKAQLLNEKVDVIFTLEAPFEHPDLDKFCIQQEDVVIIANPAHPLATLKDVRPGDLQGEPLLLTDTGCSYRHRFEEVLHRHQVVNEQRLEFSSIEVIKSCAKLGTGIAAISKISVAKELANGELAELAWRGEDLSVGLYMLWSKKRTLPPRISAFIKLIRDSAHYGQSSPASAQRSLSIAR